MERDPNISKLIRESGVVPAPENLTDRVMDLITSEPERKTYKPIIGKWGRFTIIFFIAAIVLVSLIFTEPGGRFIQTTERLSNLEMQLPQLNLSLEFLNRIKISTGLLAGVVSLFFLVLTDAGLHKRKLT